MYSFTRSLLFKLDAEAAHHLTLTALQAAYRLQWLRLVGGNVVETVPREVMGLTFPSPVGLAAGLDKNGDYIDALSMLGFGFIEVGTVTPRPQPGNPKPRLFRLPQARAIINRMGFNNKGVDYLIAQVKSARYDGVLGINIGKNFDTPIAKAVDDYLTGLRKVYPYASYVTVNISSPNTPGLRQLQQGEEIGPLLAVLKDEQKVLERAHGRYVPLVVKLAPDMVADDVRAVAQILLNVGIDGVIATNTTTSRQGVAGLVHADEQGGLSGGPLTRMSTEVVKTLSETLAGRVAIIAAGGIMSANDAQAKIAAGASLVQLYTGLVYSGPRLVKDVTLALQ